MTARVWAGLVALDIARQLYVYALAADAEGHAARALYDAACADILALAEQPVPRGWKAAGRTSRDWAALARIVERVSAEFAEFLSISSALRPVSSLHRAGDQTAARRPCVFVSGDLMTKGNDFANGGIYHHLAARGIHTLVEPACDFLEFLARVHPHLIFGRGASPARNQAYKHSMVLIRRHLYGVARRQHAWLPMPDVPAALARAGELLSLDTNGGSTLAVGSVLHHWDRGDYDGIVLTACWGCDNGLIAESLLRHRRDLPTFFHYDDATPIDERRLDSFAFRLTSRPAPAPRADSSEGHASV